MAIFNNVVCESTKYGTIRTRAHIDDVTDHDRNGSRIPGKKQRAAFIRDFKGQIWHFGIALWAGPVRNFEKGRRLCPVCERVPDGLWRYQRSGGALYIVSAQ